jgi:hypothetical protein
MFAALAIVALAGIAAAGAPACSIQPGSPFINVG